MKPWILWCACLGASACGASQENQTSAAPGSANGANPSAQTEVGLPQPTVAEDARPRISVHTAQELIAQLGSNRILMLDSPNPYAIHETWPQPHPFASGHRPPAPQDTDFVYWESPYDGWEMQVRGVENLKIIGTQAERAKIITSPRGSWVIRFADSSGVELENLEIGHTEAGTCLGGVLKFERAQDIRVTNADLFGSGTVGVGLEHVQGFRMTDSIIRDCTYQIASFVEASDVMMQNSEFRGNEQFDLIELDAHSNVHFEGCRFLNNRTSRDPFFSVAPGGILEISDSRFRGNDVPHFSGGAVTFERLTFDGNAFPDPTR